MGNYEAIAGGGSLKVGIATYYEARGTTCEEIKDWEETCQIIEFASLRIGCFEILICLTKKIASWRKTIQSAQKIPGSTSQ